MFFPIYDFNFILQMLVVSIFLYLTFISLNVPSRLGVTEYTDCFSAVVYDPQTSVLDMTLNNLMVRFQ